MTDSEAERFLEILAKDRPRLIKILIEHQSLKRHLCERTLLVATGAEDWVKRAIRRAENLHESERALRKFIPSITAQIEEAKRQTNYRECGNCAGTGLVGSDESCPCCGGTGVRYLS